MPGARDLPYPRLSANAFWAHAIGTDFWLLGIGCIEISAIAGVAELIVGILLICAPGMTLARTSVFAWALLVVAFMIVFALPALIAGPLLLEMERAFDCPSFIAARSGDPLLRHHLFSFLDHPEIHIVLLPAARLLPMMEPTLDIGLMCSGFRLAFFSNTRYRADGHAAARKHLNPISGWTCWTCWTCCICCRRYAPS